MKRILVFLTATTLCTTLSAFALDKPTNQAPNGVRLRFVPVPHSSTCGGGASWSALGPFLDIKGVLAVMAHAGLGDTFPVKEDHKPKLFDVFVVSGNDAHLKLELRSEEGLQQFDVKRDKEAIKQVKGRKYSFQYPSSTVSASEKSTTDKASIFVFRLP